MDKKVSLDALFNFKKEIKTKQSEESRKGKII